MCPRPRVGHVYFMIEHTPNRDSRITLSAKQRDELGLPRVHLDMRYGEPEFDSIGAAIGCLATELGRLDIGRVRWGGKRDQLVQSWSRRRAIIWAQRAWRVHRAKVSSTSNAACTASTISTSPAARCFRRAGSRTRR